MNGKALLKTGRSQAERTNNEVPGLQKYNKGKKMHCSNCKQPCHKRSICPTRPNVDNEGASNESTNVADN